MSINVQLIPWPPASGPAALLDGGTCLNRRRRLKACYAANSTGPRRLRKNQLTTAPEETFVRFVLSRANGQQHLFEARAPAQNPQPWILN
ncbi:MAG TPA: hypothetical protein VN736_12585 [Candidatus Limnocylindrales bacterium]|nr:hypothetical protein [Candidatus Limnocylindrales bacterium]